MIPNEVRDEGAGWTGGVMPDWGSGRAGRGRGVMTDQELRRRGEAGVEGLVGAEMRVRGGGAAQNGGLGPGRRCAGAEVRAGPGFEKEGPRGTEA